MQSSAELAAAVQRLVEDHDPRMFLVDVHWQPERKQLRLLVDTDEGIRLRECSALHQALRSLLEESGFVDEDYSLEVSSPGVGKPLKHERQYAQNVGRTVELELADGQRLAGQLIAYADGILRVQTARQPEALDIPLDTIRRTQVVPTFT